MDRLSHPFPPLYDADSRILILGSFPSVKSREAMFFYGHPQNRFWRVVSTVLGCKCPRTVEEKQQMLHTHHIALWDTIASCEISGSSDSSIREAVPTDLTPILQNAPIRQIFCNGTTAEDGRNEAEDLAVIAHEYLLVGVLFATRKSFEQSGISSHRRRSDINQRQI